MVQSNHLLESRFLSFSLAKGPQDNLVGKGSTALAEDSSLVPSTQVMGLTIACGSGSGRANTLLSAPRAPVPICPPPPAQAHGHIVKNKK